MSLIVKTQGVVLHKHHYTNISDIFYIYTKDLGKVPVICQSSKKIKSKLNGHLHAFAHIDVTLVRGRSNMRVIGVVENELFGEIITHYERISLGQEIRLITHRLTRDEDKDVRIYGLLLTFFEHLNAGELDGALLKYFYLFKLLDYLGLLPDLYSCRETGQALQPGGNFFLIADGGILSGGYVQEYGKPKESIYIHDNTLKILRLFDTLSLEDLPKLNLSSKDLGRMQSLLSQYLQYHTDLSV